ncbi:dephospho-CoA kinase [candidate division KSB1 bacterium]|nr:MAG: dephospho-CoA kinase [candidate division KSB1 bacterium]
MKRSSYKVPVIGVTGIIGSGKSTVSSIFAKLGAKVFDADQVAKEITDTDQKVLAAIRADFGEAVFTSSGKLDRQKLAARAFSDPGALQALNPIVHPKVIQRLREFIAQAQTDPSTKLVVVDIPLLYEIGLESAVDAVVVVEAPEEVCIQRAHHARGWSTDEIRQRLRNQLPQQEKVKRADFVISNDGTIEALAQKCKIVFDKILKGFPKR